MRGRAAPFRSDRPAVAELTAGAVVVGRDDGRFLLLHQLSEDRWCLPKGHVEPGESVAAAARREVEEETGLTDVELGEEVCQVEYRFFDPRQERNVFKTTVYFLGWSQGSPLRVEAGFDRAEWFDPGVARERVRYDTERTAIDAARAAVRDRRRS